MARRNSIIVVLIVLLAGGGLLVWKPQIAPIERTQSFQPDLLEKGRQLAALGNCAECHTASGGKSYAGSRALPTPFGTIYTSNITPDPETGIGLWSEAAFQRALREGVDREGRHLYPAFPYDHFTGLTDEDIHALYAFVMTRDAVRNIPPVNDLRFPFNIRPLLAGWKLLFLSRGPRSEYSTQGAEMSRGMYLAETVAHCGACHSPRNSLGAEKKSNAYDGGDSEGWHAPALNANSRAPVPWTANALFEYLRTGWQVQHGASAGPMAPVTESMGTVPEADVRAIAVYIASRSVGRQPTPALAKADTTTASSVAAIYAGACGNCHDSAPGAASQGIPLSLMSSLRAPQARNALNAILYGIPRHPGRPGPFMPAFEGTLTDAQIEALAAYIRGRFTDEVPWRNIHDELGEIRKGNQS